MTSITFSDVTFLRCIDADTCDLRINIFIGKNFYEGPCRFAGINAPELHKPDGSSNPAGVAARDALLPWLALPLKVDIKEGDKYSRPLTTVWAKKGTGKAATWVNVNQWMLDNKFAVKMSGSKIQTQDEQNAKTLPKGMGKHFKLVK